MDRIENQDIQKLNNAFESGIVDDITKAYGNIYIKLRLILDTEIRNFGKYNHPVIVDEEAIIDEAVCVLIDSLYNDRIRNKGGYCIIALKRSYWRKIKNNMEPNHELMNDVYKACTERLDLLEKGLLDLSEKETKKQIRQNTEIIRRIKRKSQAFKPIQISGTQKAQEMESYYADRIDRPKIRISLKSCLKKLTKQQRLFFLKSLKKNTQHELAIEMNLTDERISQILSEARDTLSSCLEKWGFKKEDLYL